MQDILALEVHRWSRQTVKAYLDRKRQGTRKEKGNGNGKGKGKGMRKRKHV